GRGRRRRPRRRGGGIAPAALDALRHQRQRSPGLRPRRRGARRGRARRRLDPRATRRGSRPHRGPEQRIIRILMQDIRYAVRWLARNPGFTAVAIATLAMAVGVNAAIFTFVRGVLLKPLPYPRPRAIVQIWERTDRNGQVQNMVPLSYPNFLDFRSRSRSFETMAAYSDSNFNLTGRGVPEQLAGGVVSASFFRVLGVAPLAGRTFQDDEEKAGPDGVPVIPRRLWQRRV